MSSPGPISANKLVAQLALILKITEINESTLLLCVKLLDEGVDPEALATAIARINDELRTALA